MGSELELQGRAPVTSVYHEDAHAEDKRPYINTGWTGTLFCGEASSLAGAA